MIKNCPICQSPDLESEPSCEHGSTKLINSRTYLCNECGAEFVGKAGGIVFIYNPEEEGGDLFC